MKNYNFPARVQRPGVEEHFAMIDVLEVSADDGCSVFETTALPYRNIEEVRKMMLETQKRNFEEIMAKFFTEEPSN